MKTTLWTLSFLAAAFLIFPVSCKKDKGTKPTNQGQNNNNNGNNNNGNGGQGQNSNSTIYFRGTVNGTKAEWSRKNLSYRLIARGGGSESNCDDNTKQRITAGFALETYTGVEQFYISLSSCSDLDIMDEFFGNCDLALNWLERETTFPIRATEEVFGAHIKFKLPSNGNTYITAGTTGTVKLTKVERLGEGTYSDPRYVVTGTFNGSLANLNNPMDQIEIKDGTFRIYLGVCLF